MMSSASAPDSAQASDAGVASRALNDSMAIHEKARACAVCAPLARLRSERRVLRLRACYPLVTPPASRSTRHAQMIEEKESMLQR